MTANVCTSSALREISWTYWFRDNYVGNLYPLEMNKGVQQIKFKTIIDFFLIWNCSNECAHLCILCTLWNSTSSDESDLIDAERIEPTPMPTLNIFMVWIHITDFSFSFEYAFLLLMNINKNMCKSHKVLPLHFCD